MNKRIGFRFWFYFRSGWSTYFAFIFAAINTLIVTYYLAIERYPTLESIFPTFSQYVMIVIAIGIPLLTGIGYIHWKRSPAYRSEAEVYMESNPFFTRILVNTSLILNLNLKLIKLTAKASKNEKLTNDELDEIDKLEKEIHSLLNDRSLSNKSDIDYFKKYEE